MRSLLSSGEISGPGQKTVIPPKVYKTFQNSTRHTNSDKLTCCSHVLFYVTVFVFCNSLKNSARQFLSNFLGQRLTCSF